MRSQKGITLVSLIIYLVALIFVISTLSIASNFFFSNKSYLFNESRYIAEYNKFNMYFIEDVKNNKKAVVEQNGNEIIFEDGTVYSFVGEQDRGVYRNKVKICTNISNCVFSISTLTVNNVKKKIVNVNMEIDGFKAENEYVLKYW